MKPELISLTKSIPSTAFVDQCVLCNIVVEYSKTLFIFRFDD